MTALSAPSVRGNALFIVLIAVALFGAFVFAMSRPPSVDLATPAQNAMYAQDIYSYAEKISGAVQSVMLQNNCRDTQVSFENSTVNGYANGTNDACKVFDTAGGGRKFDAPPSQAVDTAAATDAGSSLAGNYFFSGNIVVDGAGTSEPDLVFVMPWVTLAACQALNRISTKSPTIPTDAGTSFGGTKFQGTYASTHTLDTGTGLMSGCYSGSSGYHFYYVLLAR